MRMPATRLARQLSFAGYAGLLVVLSLQVFGIEALALPARGFLWLVVTAPLLVLLPGLLRGAWKSHVWLCFVLLVYFLGTVAGLARPPNAILEWLQLVLICLVFVSAMLYARWQQRQRVGDGVWGGRD